MFILLAALTFIASFIGTLAGFGSSIFMLPIVLLLFPLPEALLLVGFVHFFNDIWEVLLFRGKPHWETILVFGGTGVVATLIGANLVFEVSPQILSRILGILLVGIVLILNTNDKINIPESRGALAVGGSISGFIAGIIGIGGPLRSVFLSGYKLTKKEYIFTMGVVSFVVDAARLATYITDGASLPQGLSFSILLLIPISLAAAEIGKHIVEKIPQEKFQLLLSIFLVLIGIKFILIP